MNELTVFNNEQFGQVRTIEESGKVLFCGSDIAKALGYTNPTKAIGDHCRAITKRSTPISGKMQEINFIPESDVYRLIVKSQLPEAEKFEAWVFDDVLPSIRKTGGYISGQNELTPEELMAKALLVAQSTIAEREARISNLTVQNQIMSPKADYFDELVDRNLLTSFRDTAKQLEVKERDFVSFLIGKKYIYRDKKGKLMPYADKSDGLFEVKECVNEKTQWAGVQTLVTPKGRETFRLLMLKAGSGKVCGGVA